MPYRNTGMVEVELSDDFEPCYGTTPEEVVDLAWGYGAFLPLCAQGCDLS